jgi:hypothetical protein
MVLNMAWDFTVDSDIQLDMAKVLKNKADELDTQFANLYTQIGPSNLGTHWVGSDYDAFNVGCEGYKQALQDMTDSIRMYADHFESVAEGTDALSSMCISIVQNMTTRGDALPGGQLPVAPNINYPTGGNPTGGTQYGGGTSTVYGPPTGGSNRFNGGGGTYTNPSTVYGPPPTQSQGGYSSGPSTVYGPPTGNSGYVTGSSGNVSTVYGPPPSNNRFNGGSTGNVSTVYGPAPTPQQGFSSHSNISTVYGPGPTPQQGFSSHSNISTVYGPGPKPQVGYSESAPVCVYAPPQVDPPKPIEVPEPEYGMSESVSAPVCVYAPPQYMGGGGSVTVQPPISTVYGPAPVDRGTIVYPDSGSSTPISTVYGAPVRGGETMTTPAISTVYGAPVQDKPKIVEL